MGGCVPICKTVQEICINYYFLVPQRGNKAGDVPKSPFGGAVARRPHRVLLGYRDRGLANQAIFIPVAKEQRAEMICRMDHLNSNQCSVIWEVVKVAGLGSSPLGRLLNKLLENKNSTEYI